MQERSGGRTGLDLFEGEPGYEEIVADPVWREVKAKLSGPGFAEWLLGYFRDDLIRYRCAIDTARITYVDRDEGGSDIGRATLATAHPPEALFTRFDFQAATAAYPTYSHRDWPRRLIGGLIFFSDAETEGLAGGEFAFYDRNSEGSPPRSEPLKRIPVRGNSGVIFLNCDEAFHGPTKIHRMHGLRRWIYLSLSSHSDVWPRARYA